MEIKNAQELNQLIYKYKSNESGVRKEAEGYYVVTQIEISLKGEGIKMHYQGMEYPQKTCPVADAVASINIFKRMVMYTLKFSPLLSPLFLGMLVSTKLRNKAVSAFVDVGMRSMGDYILKYEFMTPLSREILKFFIVFFDEMKIKDGVKLAELIANTIDYDNAYRYRIQDLLCEATKENLLTNRTIKKLTKIHGEREVVFAPVKDKVKLFSYAFRLLLLYPETKKALYKALEVVDYDKMLPDKEDRFWMCVTERYNYFGKTDQERKMMINHLRVSKKLTKKQASKIMKIDD